MLKMAWEVSWEVRRRVGRLNRCAVASDVSRRCSPISPVVRPAPTIAPTQQSPHTSEIPFLCCLRYSVVHAIRLGFLRWRKRDSVLPFWKRKILLSPRT